MSSWNSVVPSRSELREAKRTAVLRAAAISFNRQGFHSTSLDDIARNLGVTKAALYHYFPNKHAVLMACFQHAMSVAFENYERAVRVGANGRERLRLTLRGYLEEIISELSCSVVLMEENALLPQDQIVMIKERDRFEKALRDLVSNGIDDGSIAPCDPKLAIFALLGAINWVPKWFSHAGPWSAEQLTTAITDLFDRALSSTPCQGLTTDVGSLTSSDTFTKGKRAN